MNVVERGLCAAVELLVEVLEFWKRIQVLPTAGEIPHFMDFNSNFLGEMAYRQPPTQVYAEIIAFC